MTFLRDGFSLWNPRLIGTPNRRVEEAEAEAAKWKGRYYDLLSKVDDLHLRLRDAEDGVMAYEDALRLGVIRYATKTEAKLAASPTSPRVMIGRQPTVIKPLPQSTEE